MADYLEGLELEIVANSSGATNQLKALETNLSNLKKATSSGGNNLAKFAANFKILTDSIKTNANVTREGMSNLERIAGVLEKLNVAVKGKPGSEMSKIASATKEFSSEGFNFEGLTTLAEKMEAFNGIDISKGFGTQLKNIAKFSQEIKDYDFTKLDELTTALAKLKDLSKVDSSSMKDLTASMKNYSNSVKTSANHSKTFNTVLSNIKLTSVAVVAAMRKVGNIVTKSLDEYGDYVETMNLFSVSMGNAGEAAYEFAEKAQRVLGIDLTQWMKAQGVFMSLGKGFGIAEDKAATMSQQLTQLAYDISSFYNISVEDAIQKVQSAFSGELEPVRRLGYDLSQARLQAIALSYGIEENVSSMTQAEKASLRYIALLTQVTDVQGDLARTLESPTNQLRILQAQLQQMYRSIGMTFIPLLNKILPYLNAILRVIKMIADEIAGIFGITLPSISSSSFNSSIVEGMADIEESAEGASSAAESLKNTLASFDQINLIGSSSSSGGGSGSGSGGVGGSGYDFDVPTYDFLGDAVESKAQDIANSMMSSLRPAIDFVKEAIVWVSDNLDEIEGMLLTIAAVSIGTKLVGSIKDAKNVWGDLSGAIGGLTTIAIGLTFSYIGGKDIAKGNVLRGILESVLGTGAAAIGAGLAFGVAGVTITLTAGLVLTYIGYKSEKHEEYIQSLQDLYYSLDNDRTAISDFTKAWQDAIAVYDNSAIQIYIDGAKESKQDIQNIASAISALEESYSNNEISLDEYSRQMEYYYGLMETAATTHLSNISSAIVANLQGPFGVFLELQGYAVEDIIASFQATEASLSSSYQNITFQMKNLTEQYNAGHISSELYHQRMQELQSDYDALGIEIIKASGSQQQFDSLFDIKGIDYSNVDDVTGAISTIKETYVQAYNDIDEDYKTAMEAWNTGLANAIRTGDEDAAAMYESLLGLTEEYYSQQFDQLNSTFNYSTEFIKANMLSDWQTTFGGTDLHNAVEAMGDDFITVQESFDSMYSSLSEFGLEQPVGEFEKVTGAMQTMMDLDQYAGEGGFTQSLKDLYSITKDYGSAIFSDGDWPSQLEEQYNEAFSELHDFTHNTERQLKDSEGNFKAFSGAAGGHIDGMMAKLTPQARQYLGSFINESDIKMYQFKQKMTGGMDGTFASMVNTMSDKKGTMKSAIQTPLNGVLTALQNGSPEMQAKAKNIMTTMANELGDPQGQSKEKLKSMLNGLAQVDTTSFGTAGTSLRDKLIGNMTSTSGIVSPMTNLKNAIKTALDPEGTGEGWGLSLFNGIKNKMTGNPAAGVISNMASGFSGFTGSLYDLLSTVTSGTVDFWNNISISTGSAKLKSAVSSFANKAMWKIKGYATGGFPDSADFFYANEDGTAEYIGSMGGKTAVANNDDIRRGIADAVYKAIKDTGIQTDVRKIAQKNPNVVFAPSEQAGRVMQQSVNMYNRTGGRY